MASIVVENCVCRQNCAPNGKNLGIVNGTFEVLEERERNGITWYRIDDNKWIQAGSGVDLISDNAGVTESDTEADFDDNSGDSQNTEDSKVEDIEDAQPDESETHEDALSDSIVEQAEFRGQMQPEVEDADDKDDDFEDDEEQSSSDDIQDDDGTSLPIPYSVGDTVTFSGNRHYASPEGAGGAFVKPCMATIVDYVPGEEYPIKLHRCNAAGHLISRGSMGYVSLRDVCLIRSNS